jgi:hypothetical protein
MSRVPERPVDALRPVLLSLLKTIPDQPDEFSDLVARLASRNDAELWQGLIACASHHGVLAVVDRQLTTHAMVPQDVRDTTERRLVIDRLWQDHLVESLEAAVGALAGCGIETCAMKGPVLAARLYPSTATRHCLDIDLLVKPGDFRGAVDALKNAGFTTSSGVSAAYLQEHSHHLAFSRPHTAPIELHFRAYAGFGVVLPASVLLDRATPFQLTPTLSVLAPSPEDEFIYLATHATGHSFIRLVWLYDLKLLVLRYPSLDWEQIGVRCKALGVSTPVAYAARLLNEWLGVSAGPLNRRSPRLGLRTGIADFLLAEVSRPQPPSVRDNLGGLVFTALLCDTWSASAWLLQHHILRGTRRRLKNLAPAYLPEEWSA